MNMENINLARPLGAEYKQGARIVDVSNYCNLTFYPLYEFWSFSFLFLIYKMTK